tara:strand:+ start:416 stop:679 length:264 start_codon:yes stop_codon:yes gene_type:complete
MDNKMSYSQSYLDAVERLKSVDWSKIPNFPDEIKANNIVYIQSEIGGRGNKLPSGENLGVYIPKDFSECCKRGSIKLTIEQARKLAV